MAHVYAVPFPTLGTDFANLRALKKGYFLKSLSLSLSLPLCFSLSSPIPTICRCIHSQLKTQFGTTICKLDAGIGLGNRILKKTLYIYSILYMYIGINYIRVNQHVLVMVPFTHPLRNRGDETLYFSHLEARTTGGIRKDIIYDPDELDHRTTPHVMLQYRNFTHWQQHLFGPSKPTFLHMIPHHHLGMVLPPPA